MSGADVRAAGTDYENYCCGSVRAERAALQRGYDEMRGDYAAAVVERNALRERVKVLEAALRQIALGPPAAEDAQYSLAGDFEEDARHVYPARENWLRATADAALTPSPDGPAGAEEA